MKVPPNKTLYENIKKRRMALHMTQKELAKLVGYEHSMVAKIESGKVDLPLSRIFALAAALRTTPAYLTGWMEAEAETDALMRKEKKHRKDERA